MSIAANRAAALTAIAAVAGFTGKVTLQPDRAGADRAAATAFGDAKRAAIGAGQQAFPAVDPSMIIPVWLHLFSTDADAGDLDAICATVRTALDAIADEVTLDETTVMADLITRKKLRILINTYWSS